MISFAEACENVGYDRNAIYPEKKIVYLAYKNGECKEFDTLNDAKSFSKQFEKKVVNQEIINDFHKRQREKARLAGELFLHEFRKGFPELSDDQFSCIWSKAWEDTHYSYGYDEVASMFDDLYFFIKKYTRCGK